MLFRSEVASELAKNGMNAPATGVEQRARQGIDELRKGVERAAESVLGDETEALKQAAKTLDSLARQLEREIARGEGKEGKEGESQPGEQPGGQKGKPGQQAKQDGDGKQPGKQAGKQGGGKAGENSKDGKPGEAQAGNEPGEQGGKQGSKSGQDGKPGEATERSKSGQGGKQGEGKEAGKSGQDSQQPGDKEGKDGKSGKAGQPGQKQGEQPGQQPGKGGGSGQQPGEQAGKANGQNQPQEGQASAANRNGGVNTASNRGGADGSHTGDYQNGGGNRRGSWDNILSGRDAANRELNLAPITGGGFEQFSDRLRDAEEMVDANELRNQLQTVRERLRMQRVEFKRSEAEPKWDLVKLQILTPLVEVRKRIEEDLAKRDSREAMVPIDRDPVPGRFSELVRKYYENLGKDSGK